MTTEFLRNVDITIGRSEPSSTYFQESLYKIPIIKIPMYQVYVLDYDKKDLFINSCGAYVETDKGYHFIFAPDKVSPKFEKMQDAKFMKYSTHNGYWSQFTCSKVTGEKRVMKVNKEGWEEFVDKWNTLAKLGIVE
jgi:hypothetical protein